MRARAGGSGTGSLLSAMSEVPAPATATPKAARRRRWIRIAQVVVSLALVVGIFVFAVPRIADYSKVWSTIAALTWFELATLVAVAVFNLVTYWPVMVASMPGLTLGQAAVNNQTTTSVANTLPFGGAIAVPLSYAMYRSWGFTNSQIALTTLVTGIWNTFIKLGLPVVALALLAIQGQAGGGLLLAAMVGLAFLAAAIVLFGLMLWRERFARAIGAWIGRVVSSLRLVIRRPPVEGWGDAAVRFRKQTIGLLSRRWIPLTVATVISHLSLYLVLLFALRHVGVSEREISAAQVLGVFAFGRLVSAFPITPGGLGLVELSYIGGLVLAGRDHTDVSPEVFRAQVAAAVLVFRTLTYALQIPLGGITYLIWRSKSSWRKPVPAEPDPALTSG
jgi:putative heme transporter